MKAIFASKLYRSSTRKDKIKAALNNPINAELVQQLKIYLDDEYQSPEYIDPNYVKDVEPQVDESQDAAGSNNIIDFDSDDFPDYSGHISPPPTSSPPNSFDDADIYQPEAPEPTDESVLEVSDDLDLDEDINLDDISESSELDTTIDSSDHILDIEDIRDILSTNEDTVGVNRLLIKNDELWIYYGDKYNLNLLMGPVIELIGNSKYNYLEFNRLARSDNAIVFEINSSVVLEPHIADETK